MLAWPSTLVTLVLLVVKVTLVAPLIVRVDLVLSLHVHLTIALEIAHLVPA